MRTVRALVIHGDASYEIVPIQIHKEDNFDVITTMDKIIGGTGTIYKLPPSSALYFNDYNRIDPNIVKRNYLGVSVLHREVFDDVCVIKWDWNRKREMQDITFLDFTDTEIMQWLNAAYKAFEEKKTPSQYPENQKNRPKKPETEEELQERIKQSRNNPYFGT